MREVADSGRNVMPALLDAACADVTEGELVAALQGVCGVYTEL